MNTALNEQKTAVFEPAQKTMVFRAAELSHTPKEAKVPDEPTRELPLIADRFVGRYWIPEHMQSEADGPRHVRVHPARRTAPVFLLGGFAAALLLMTLLTGQARAAFSTEETVSEPEPAAIVTLEEEAESRGEVLGVRRGQEMTYAWNSLVGSVSEAVRRG